MPRSMSALPIIALASVANRCSQITVLSSKLSSNALTLKRAYFSQGAYKVDELLNIITCVFLKNLTIWTPEIVTYRIQGGVSIRTAFFWN